MYKHDILKNKWNVNLLFQEIVNIRFYSILFVDVNTNKPWK